MSHCVRFPATLLLSALLSAGCAPTDTGRADGASEDLTASVLDLMSVGSLERHAQAIVQYERPSGSPGENAAIDSIVASLRADGVPVEVFTFDTYASDPISAEVSVPAAGLSFESITMSFSGEAEGLEGPLVDVGALRDLPELEVGTGERLVLEGDASTERGALEDLPDLTGTIALVEGQPRNVSTATLALLGAAGVIFMNPEERLNDLIVTTTWGTVSLRNYQRLPSIPTVQIAKSAGDRLRELLGSGPVDVRISADVQTGRKPLRLAVARVEGPTPDAPFVLLGGHIDGWYHGGTDEGASNAVMVELAKAFHRNKSQLTRGLVVAWWPGHSNARYAGSTWFADHYFEELRDRAVAYLNIDGLGQIDANRVSATATASMVRIASEVVREALGQDSVGSSTPGRNSDQAFNGVGLPLLQFNHSRPGELGGYWWWHTPEDTYDKIDFDILLADAGLYARALAKLLTDPALPIDLPAEVEELGAAIERRAQQAGGGLYLSEALDRQADLLDAVRRIDRALGGSAGPDIDRGLLRVLRPVYRVLYDPVDPFHPDPGFSLGLLPGLAPVTILAEEDPGSDRYLFAETTLVRERNRLLEALDVATEEAGRLLERLGR